MYLDLNSAVDEVKQIEGKVVEISQLVDVFSEKILQQVPNLFSSTVNRLLQFWFGISLEIFWYIDVRIVSRPLSSYA